MQPLHSMNGYIHIILIYSFRYEQKVKNLTEWESYHQQMRKEHKRNREYDDFSGLSTLAVLLNLKHLLKCLKWYISYPYNLAFCLVKFIVNSIIY